MKDFTFKFESPTPDGFDNRPGKANALNQTGSELHIPELYARVREYCKENPIPDYTSLTPHGGVRFRYEGGEFKPLDKESFDRYVSLVNGAPVKIPNLNKDGYSWFMEFQDDKLVSVDLGTLDQSDKPYVFTAAKPRCIWGPKQETTSGIFDTPFAQHLFKDLANVCRKTWEQVARNRDIFTEAVKLRGADVPLAFLDDASFSNYPRGQITAIIDVDESPFFEVPTEPEEPVDLSKCNFVDQPLVWNGGLSLNATFTEVPQCELGTVSNFFDQWASAIANAGETAGCFSADHIHDAFGVAVPEGNYYLKEVETMKDVDGSIEVGLDQLTVKTEYNFQDSAMGQSVIKFHGAGNASVLLTDRFTHVDVPAQAAETLRSFVNHFGEPGLVEINKQFFENVKNDSEYAWGWLCNLACPLMDAGLTHEAANLAAARQMQHVFKIDITQHPHWADFETQWTAAKTTPVQAAADTDVTTNVSGKHWTQL